MRFDEFNEALDKGHKAAIKGMHQLSGDQYYGLYKTMNDVAGHDGKKQTAPNGNSDDEVSDKPFAYAYTDEEEAMIKAADPKAKKITSSKSEELDEDFDPTRKQRLDDLIDQYKYATDPIGYDDDAPDPDEVIAQIRQEFGDKIADTIEQGPSSHFPRDNHSRGYDPLDRNNSPRITKSGMVNRQDVSALKGNLKQRIGSHSRPNLPEQGMSEAGRNYDDNRTGFAKPQRNDDERHDLDAPKPLIYGLKINGKIWKKDGNVVTFFTKERALAARNSILAKRPDVEVGLVQRPQD